MAARARKERQRLANRDLILKAAREIIVGEGFRALTMRKIAEKTDYVPGAIYLYFSSRDEIARHVCIEGYREWLAFLQPALTVEDPVERLVAYLNLYARFGFAHPETYRLMYMEDPAFSKAELRQAPLDAPKGPGFEAFGHLVSILTELRRRRLLSTHAKPEELADMVWTAVHGVVSLKLLYPKFPRTSADRLVAMLVGTLLRGLLVDTARPNRTVRRATMRLPAR
jgi:AcrR family transcriptional regulator